MRTTISLDHQSSYLQMTVVSKANKPIIRSDVNFEEAGSFAQFLAKERDHLQLFSSIRKKTLANNNREKEKPAHTHSPSRQACSNENWVSNNWKIIEREEAIPDATQASDLSSSNLSNVRAWTPLTDSVTHAEADVSRVGSQSQLHRAMIAMDDTSDDSAVVAFRFARRLESNSNLNIESVRNANAVRRYSTNERKVHRSRCAVRRSTLRGRERRFYTLCNLSILSRVFE